MLDSGCATYRREDQLIVGSWAPEGACGSRIGGISEINTYYQDSSYKISLPYNDRGRGLTRKERITYNNNKRVRD